jgi:hypothetical protein
MNTYADLELLTLDPDADNSNLPEGGFINDDSHLIDFISQYFEEEVADEPEYEEWWYYQDPSQADEDQEEF